MRACPSTCDACVTPLDHETDAGLPVDLTDVAATGEQVDARAPRTGCGGYAVGGSCAPAPGMALGMSRSRGRAVPAHYGGRVVRADEEYVEAVLTIVEAIPRGRVTTYGAIGDVVGSGPRLVGNVMARHGGPVPWWRVVRADGSLPTSHVDEGRAHYLEEGTPLRRSGRAVDIVAAFWSPAD